MHQRSSSRPFFRLLTRAAVAVGLGALAATLACAPKRGELVARPVPDWDVVERIGIESPENLSASQRKEFDRGWKALREGRLDVASADLEGIARSHGKDPRRNGPELATALGYLDFRLGNVGAAETGFQAVLQVDPAYGPAQAGYFLAALSTGDEEKAFERLKRLEASYPEHELVDRYGTTLRVNVAETRLRTARELAGKGRYEDAARSYIEALEVAPEAGSVYVEAAEAELKAGYPARAREHAFRATELETANADAFRVFGEALYQDGDLSGAARALRNALSLRPTDGELLARVEAVEAELREKTLPPEYAAIADTARLTREQLAALVSVELKSALDTAPVEGNVIATDIAESWALPYIRRVVGAGVLEVFPNHTFQPMAFVNRIELARTLARALQVLAPDAYDRARASSGFEEGFADLPRQNVSYEAAAIAVSLGLLRSGEGRTFEPQRLVSGADATTAVVELGVHMTP
jgi:tetratricopeptide (TPR) repeat protein